MIDEDDLRGLTSNPTIFEKAIGGSDDYDAQLRDARRAEQIARRDLRRASPSKTSATPPTSFVPSTTRCKGGDGFCSLEVSPLLASDTAGTDRRSEAALRDARTGRT